MILTESDARQLMPMIRERLEKIGALEVLEGIDESRRFGVEIILAGEDGKDIKQVGRMRRRPLNAIEELEVVLQRLRERLVVVPGLATSILDHLKVNVVEWLVDTEFVSTSRIPEVSIAMLLPQGREDVTKQIAEIMKVTEETFARGGK
jgi:hypothetical protein